MAKRLTIHFTDAERAELAHARDRDPRPYVRERAAALLKLEAGQSGRAIAQQGLLKKRYPEAVYRWYHRYQAEHLAGLLIRTGRGRKPAFSPSVPHECASAGRAAASPAPQPGPVWAAANPLDAPCAPDRQRDLAAPGQPARAVALAAAAED